MCAHTHGYSIDCRRLLVTLAVSSLSLTALAAGPFDVLLVAEQPSSGFVAGITDAGHNVTHVQNPDDMPADLAQFAVIILADPSEALSELQENSIDGFVQSGGGLIIFENTIYDQLFSTDADCNPVAVWRLGRTNRCRTTVVSPHSIVHALPTESTLEGGSASDYDFENDAEIVIEWTHFDNCETEDTNNTPMAVTYTHGGGRVVYFNDHDAHYLIENWKGDPDYGTQLMHNAIDYAAGEGAASGWTVAVIGHYAYPVPGSRFIDDIATVPEVAHVDRLMGHTEWPPDLTIYNVVVLAGAYLCIDEEKRDALDRYVFHGGGLISFETRDNWAIAEARCHLVESSGGEGVGWDPIIVDYSSPLTQGFTSNPEFRGDMRENLTLRAGALVAIEWDDGAAMAVTGTYGRGRIVLFNDDDTWNRPSSYGWLGDPDSGTMVMQNAVRYVGGNPSCAYCEDYNILMVVSSSISQDFVDLMTAEGHGVVVQEFTASVDNWAPYDLVILAVPYSIGEWDYLGALEEFVASGGGLIIFERAIWNEFMPTTSPLSPVESCGTLRDRWGMNIEDGQDTHSILVEAYDPHHWYVICQYPTLKAGVQVLMSWNLTGNDPDNPPAATIHSYGEGNIVYFNYFSTSQELDSWASGYLSEGPDILRNAIDYVMNSLPGSACSDCNENGICDEYDIAYGECDDCDGNGVPDECDIEDGTLEDADDNGIPDDCEPVDMCTSSVSDRSGTVLLSFSESDPDLAYKGTAEAHIATIRFHYSGDKLTQIVTTPTDGTASVRTVDVIYDPGHPDRVIGTMNADCGCADSHTFVYRDEYGHVAKITTAELPPETAPILEEFQYVSDTDDRLTVRRRLCSDGVLRNVERRIYADDPEGSYVVTIRSLVEDGLEAVREESYDSDRRLTWSREYSDLVAIDGTPTSDPDETTYDFEQDEADGYVWREKRETVRPSGVRVVTEWEITGTPYQAGSTKYVQSYLADVPDPPDPSKMNWRRENYEYNAAYGDYRLTQTIEPTGKIFDYAYYDPDHPEQLYTETHSDPDGDGPLTAVTITHQYDDAGRVTHDARPGPNGDVTAFYSYDGYGRLTSSVDDYGGLNRTTEYVYDAFDQQVLTRNPDGLVRGAIYDDSGRLESEYACDHPYPDPLFQDVTAPPAGSLLSFSTYAYHSAAGRLELQGIALVDEVPFALDPLNPTCDIAYTEHSLDTTGTWLLGTSLPYTGTASGWTWYGHDYQGRVIQVESPGGVYNVTVYDGRGLAKERTTTDNPTNPGAEATLTTTTQYNPDGQVELVGYPNGTAMEYGYDSWGRMNSEKRHGTSGDIQRFYVRDEAGLVTRRHGDGVEDVVTDYDDWGRPWRVRRRATYGVDGNDDSNGMADLIMLTEYNVIGSVGRTAVKGPEGDPSMIEEGTDQITQYTHDNVGRVVETARVNVDDEQTVFYETTQDVYDDLNRVRYEIVDPGDLNITVAYLLDAAGRVLRVTDPVDPGDTAGYYRTQLYDSRGNLVRRVAYEPSDPDDVSIAQERSVYNVRNQLKRSARMAVAGTTVPNEDISRLTDHVTDYEYDDDGRVRFVHRYNMNEATQLTSETQYDDIGRPKKIIDPIPSGTYVENFYESGTGLLQWRDVRDLTSQGTYWVEFGYDPYKRVEIETRSEAGAEPLTTTYEYDDADRVTRVIDPKGIKTDYDYDLIGRRRLVTENAEGSNPNPSATCYYYDRLGQLWQRQAYDDDGSGGPGAEWQVTTYGYDLVGRRTEIIFPDTGPDDTVQFSYDLAGRLGQKIDQRGVTVDYVYYDRGLLDTRTATCASCGDDFVRFVDDFDYDGLGRMTLAVRQAGDPGAEDEISRSEFDYTGLGDKAYETQVLHNHTADARTFEYEYDQAGNRMSMDCDPTDILSVSYDEYDAMNRVTEMTVDPGGADILVDYAYDGKYLDQRSVTTGVNTEIEYDPDYDEHRRIDAIVNCIDGAPADLAAFDYEYDDAGNRDYVTQSGNDVHSAEIDYNYDNLHRLSWASYTNSQIDPQDGDETFSMDLLGNRTQYEDERDGTLIDYEQANAANEYASADGTAIGYDAAGNLYEYDDGFRYGYDFENRLVRVEHSPFGPVGGWGFIMEGGSMPPVPYRLIATFEYDALGRRIRATYYNNRGNIVDDTLYYYDGQRVVAEYDYDETAGTQTLARWFVDGPLYLDEHVMMHDATTGDDYFYLPQEFYSVAGLVDQDGELVEAHAYDAYGDVRIFDLTGPTPIELDFSAVGNPYYFTGRRRDPIHNPLALPVSYRPLYHYRARAYDPLHGRFLQRDPAEYVDGMNLYEYVRSNSVRWGDPWGLVPPEVPPWLPGESPFRPDPSNPGSHTSGQYDATDGLWSSGLFWGGEYSPGDTIKIPEGQITVRSFNLWTGLRYYPKMNLSKAACVLEKLGFLVPEPENGVYWARVPRGIDGYTLSGTGFFWNYIAASFINTDFDVPTRQTRDNLVFRELAITLYHELKGHNQDKQDDGAAFDATYERPIKHAWDTRKRRRAPGYDCCDLTPNTGKLVKTELDAIMCECLVAFRPYRPQGK